MFLTCVDPNKGGINMFNYKMSLLGLKSHNENHQKLPADFGSMYFLYPPETVDFFKIKSMGVIDKIVSAVRRKLKNSDSDVEYYKNDGIG
jgi:hypothetical protein